ncbi:MAG: YicC family protein [Planctomycetota bacterium]
MTGFGQGRAEGGVATVEVQIATVNNRSCRVSVRGDVRDLAHEEAIRKRIQDALRRGSITVRITVTMAHTAAVDGEQVQAAYRELAALAAACGAPAPTLTDAMRLVGSGQAPVADDGVTALIDQAVAEAVAACQAMRATEGAAMAAAFVAMHAELGDLAAAMAEQAATRVPAYAERLRERLTEIVTDRADITPEHLVRELAIYADRIDVTEEQVRLRSHLDQFATLIGAGEEVGKRIEFLLQEIGREVNTTGSKANDAELQQLVVRAKNLLDQCKEQAANIL